MLRMKNNNHKRSSRKKHSNQVDKNLDSKSNYEEDFNEVILNDLVPDDKKEEFGLEETKPRTKKSSPFNLGLGAKKKPTKKRKVKKEDDSTEVSKTTKESKNKKTHSKQTNSKKTHSKTTKKSHPKNESIDNETDNIVEKKVENKVDNTETENKNIKNHKKSHSKNHSHKRKIKKYDNEDSLEVKENIIQENKEVLEDVQEQNEVGSFRGIENDNLNKVQEIEVVEETKKDDKRVENIVWSKESFPKK